MPVTDAQRLIDEMEQLGVHVRLQDGNVYATFPNGHPSFGGDLPEPQRSEFAAHFGEIQQELRAREPAAAASTVVPAKSGAFNSRLATWSAARAERRRQGLVNRLADRTLS